MPTPWKGIAVGSVQSGKTLGMMGVTAVALDAGYRLVVVLAGLKDDLRTQTARRFNTQLLLQNDPVPGLPAVSTLGGTPGPRGEAIAFTSPYFRDCIDDGALPVRLPAHMARGAPAVLIIKKNPASLARMKTLLSGVYSRLGVEAVPTLILDDECDEASVPGGSGPDKAVPEGITSLWESMPKRPNVSYLGYTATAAANLLQFSDWPLYPHYVWLMRSPGPDQNDLEFQEVDPDHWYSGGRCFFEDFGEAPGEGGNFLVRDEISDTDLEGMVDENASLENAFRAYFVAGAYRLELQPGRTLVNPDHPPSPHSMMIHTSPSQEDHSLWRSGVLKKFGERRFPDGAWGLDPDNLQSKLDADDASWREWYTSFSRSIERIYDARPRVRPYSYVSWEKVKARLPEVFGGVRVKVVNSDVGQSLDYEPTVRADGQSNPPKDVYVIAIGGSRLSRGITVKGLGISYFARWSVQRFEDTLLQMSRWYGYRGPHLEFCRVFLSQPAFQGFRELHENDSRLRSRLAKMMRDRESPAHATLVFRASPDVMPTAKLGAGQVRDLAFSPRTHVFSDVRYGNEAISNEKWAANLVSRIQARHPEPARTDAGKARGILSRGWGSLEVAEILDGLAYESHNPADVGHVHEGRFRPPDPDRPPGHGLPAENDPYHVAAYLRYWVALPAPPTPAPTFNVGISYGTLIEGTEPFTFPLLDRFITPDGKVEGAWTGRSAGWPGDYYFDRIPPELRMPPTGRTEGSPGLLILYVVHKDATGRKGAGAKREHHTPFLGICVPAGGPEFIRVIRPGAAP
jgi:Z1 domain